MKSMELSLLIFLMDPLTECYFVTTENQLNVCSETLEGHTMIRHCVVRTKPKHILSYLETYPPPC